ncbi:redox-sensitive transcriptional activator SoxR [Segniliparus rugosus]|uniref:Redox-sensitive transcriptional activator SoxR n=1 Tax=Segniliparus rugosus (strain ATCC BAA-974 / DSM 45345 / CCUG 50838 / CIP 108380 / JCM 13579 / CDC 945) TaxID=679197 RepID=E5XMI6_SEGRC|nr:redox-sensitive transcriptional activator SoxR [Segniliparus rugosus]EFV14451.1 redox-sensitive transcriptional activator SoxR [Segniliparus rugosus ATCC BAA-974]
MPSVKNQPLTIGEVAERTGAAVSALRYYESLGLIRSTRTAGNQRRFPRHALRRVSIILVAGRFGIPLAEVAEVFEGLPEDRSPTRADWRKIATRWHSKLEARRSALEQMQAQLTGCIGCGCLSLKSCATLNWGDELAAQGPGPRRLTDPSADL